MRLGSLVEMPQQCTLMARVAASAVQRIGIPLFLVSFKIQINVGWGITIDPSPCYFPDSISFYVSGFFQIDSFMFFFFLRELLIHWCLQNVNHLLILHYLKPNTSAWFYEVVIISVISFLLNSTVHVLT